MAPGKVGLSLLITGAILVVLGVFAAGRPRPVDVDTAGQGRGGGTARVLADTYINPLDPVPKAEWEVLLGCELVRTPTNAAHHFRVSWEGKPMVFELYFVAAPELTEPEEEEVAEMAQYFGWPRKGGANAWKTRSIDLGHHAWKAVESLLQSKPFMVLTKFDRRHDTHHFYGLVVIEDERGGRRTLQEWLVEHGYARISPESLGWLPLQVESDLFVERLETKQREAQRDRRGGWAAIAAAP